MIKAVMTQTFSDEEIDTLGSLCELLDVVDVQYGRRLGRYPLAQGSILCKRLTVGWNHLLQLGRPSRSCQFFSEAAFDYLNHDPDRRRSTWRGAEHRNDGTVGCANKLGANR